MEGWEGGNRYHERNTFQRVTGGVKDGCPYLAKCVWKSQNTPAQAKTSRALSERVASVSSKLATHTIRTKTHQASARAGWRAQMSAFGWCRMGGKGCASVFTPDELVRAARPPRTAVRRCMCRLRRSHDARERLHASNDSTA